MGDPARAPGCGRAFHGEVPLLVNTHHLQLLGFLLLLFFNLVPVLVRLIFRSLPGDNLSLPCGMANPGGEDGGGWLRPYGPAIVPVVIRWRISISDRAAPQRVTSSISPRKVWGTGR